MYIFLTVADIHAIHKEQLSKYGGADGFIDENAVEACAAAPQWELQYRDGDVADIAAIYLHRFASTQGFPGWQQTHCRGCRCGIPGSKRIRGGVR
jgi:prophage maintenance system killer protein